MFAAQHSKKKIGISSILSKHLTNFTFPSLKLYNQYCHNVHLSNWPFIHKACGCTCQKP